ncbi:Fe-Mn family superoxide dismutase [Patescibacteria group bacterium]|nr:Fe-Mn family superoxide dismutase [Patescibacteria group bacterium]
MQKYTSQEFNLPQEINGISSKQIEEHLKLYAGYVKHSNLIQEKIELLLQDKEQNSYIISELNRRFGFEFNGMRMHEYYFEQLEEGLKEINPESNLNQKIINDFESFGNFIEKIKEVTKTRGIGWVIVYFDKKQDNLNISWVSDHELGQLGGLQIILAIDLWEHAFMVDYLPNEKGQYIEKYLENINWEKVEKRF